MPEIRALHTMRVERVIEYARALLIFSPLLRQSVIHTLRRRYGLRFDAAIAVILIFARIRYACRVDMPYAFAD